MSLFLLFLIAFNHLGNSDMRVGWVWKRSIYLNFLDSNAKFWNGQPIFKFSMEQDMLCLYRRVLKLKYCYAVCVCELHTKPRNSDWLECLQKWQFVRANPTALTSLIDRKHILPHGKIEVGFIASFARISIWNFSWGMVHPFFQKRSLNTFDNTFAIPTPPLPPTLTSVTTYHHPPKSPNVLKNPRADLITFIYLGVQPYNHSYSMIEFPVCPV